MFCVPKPKVEESMLPKNFAAMLLLCGAFALGQSPSSSPATANSNPQLPKLEHLSADQVNPQVDPCTDFYQYSCSKFFAANPIPPDRATWGVIGPLSLWNEVTLRQVLESAAAQKQDRS